MRQITSSTLSNQDISSVVNTHTYTADADRMLFVRLFADQVAGNGTYTAYITIQRLGAGSAYEVQPRTAPTVASGVTAIAFTTVPFPVKDTDVIKVYLDGLAGDTTTPDIITEIWEDDSLRPTTAGRTLDVTATGAAGIDWGNVENPTTTVGLTGTTAGLIDDAITASKFDESTAFPLAAADSGATQVARTGADADTLETLSDQLDAVKTDTAATLTDTNELQTDWANGGRLDNILDARASQASVDDLPTNAELAAALAAADDAVLAAIAALNNLSAAQVNAEVVDALATDTYAEPSAVPAATATLAAKLNWLAMLARNRITQTATTQTLYADDATTARATSGVSDDGTTASRTEWANA